MNSAELSIVPNAFCSLEDSELCHPAAGLVVFRFDLGAMDAERTTASVAALDRATDRGGWDAAAIDQCCLRIVGGAAGGDGFAW